MRFPLTSILFLSCLVATLAASEYDLSVVARGLDHPTGITTRDGATLYVTEVPTPGVGGGRNGVVAINVDDGVMTTLSRGEPEPLNLALSPTGTLYWTCRTAGVVLGLRTQQPGATPVPVLTGLAAPTGLTVRAGLLFWTEVPTPGVAGGSNAVRVRLPWFGNITLHAGDPAPADIAVGPWLTRYWTCSTAGVIVVQDASGAKVLLSGLAAPHGIAIDWAGRNLYWTEVPTPGIAGGNNAVRTMDLKTGTVTTINKGDPQPTDVSVARDGTVFWTCTSAGVVVAARPVPSTKG
jgi:hypothetical protein